MSCAVSGRGLFVVLAEQLPLRMLNRRPAGSCAWPGGSARAEASADGGSFGEVVLVRVGDGLGAVPGADLGEQVVDVVF
jgi:hypothetical protein